MVHILILSCFFKHLLYNILQIMPILRQLYTHFFLLPMRAIYSSQLSLLDLVVLLDMITGSLQIMKLSPVQLLQSALFWYKYFPQNLVLRHSLCIFLSHYERRRYKAAWNTVQKHKLDSHDFLCWLYMLLAVRWTAMLEETGMLQLVFIPWGYTQLQSCHCSLPKSGSPGASLLCIVCRFTSFVQSC